MMKGVSVLQLSDLVLVDILAALPMSAAVGLAQLGHQRLQPISCRPWVLRRMADVNFPAAVKAYQAGGRVREAFCSEAVLTRLYGRVDARPYEGTATLLREPIVNILSEMPGYVHCKLSGHRFFFFLVKTPLKVRTKLRYITGTFDWIATERLGMFPNLAVLYLRGHCFVKHRLYDSLEYRPALLNARHAVDVLRAVCGPAVVSEAELDRVRAEATRKAWSVEAVIGEEFAGVWITKWDPVK